MLRPLSQSIWSPTALPKCSRDRQSPRDKYEAIKYAHGRFKTNVYSEWLGRRPVTDTIRNEAKHGTCVQPAERNCSRNASHRNRSREERLRQPAPGSNNTTLLFHFQPSHLPAWEAQMRNCFRNDHPLEEQLQYLPLFFLILASSNLAR